MASVNDKGHQIISKYTDIKKPGTYAMRDNGDYCFAAWVKGVAEGGPVINVYRADGKTLYKQVWADRTNVVFERMLADDGGFLPWAKAPQHRREHPLSADEFTLTSVGAVDGGLTADEFTRILNKQLGDPTNGS